ncbi:hypothetical protein K443DRAFT_110298 [Laccaria amethystina LaAM-08-1]|uniref:Uncharacterized protein n=1 Tax=Laccaria amethystina LaAM-08-1 TaxID=1095629 RepID=A0A0C9WZX2_9AGAR|nr:hypothetical protein K443DRAFT_110298 [Laccaria amethystina LaAM-08-1]
MGDPSNLRFVPSSCASIPIDWTKRGTFKKRPLPATIDDLAKMFHETKFFGYLTSELCTLLLDISEFGLAELPRLTENRLPVGPRFYMKYLSQIWFVLFVPGSRRGITGYSPDLPDRYAEDLDEDAEEDLYDEDAEIALQKALAEDFDVKLCEEVSQGGAGVLAFKKVAGWQSSTLKSSLQFAQMAEVIMELPTDHPAYVGMMQNWLRNR